LQVIEPATPETRGPHATKRPKTETPRMQRLIDTLAARSGARVIELLATRDAPREAALVRLEARAATVTEALTLPIAEIDVLVTSISNLRDPSCRAHVAKLAARVPLLVVADPDEDELAREMGAADTIRTAPTAAELARRIDLLARLRTMRRALAVAQSALAQVDGLTLADARSPEVPLVYVSRAFEAMTGYPERAVLGKNCRLLQGPDTEPAAIGELRRAIREKTPARVVVRNRRRDGTSFWNDLTIFPIADDDGAIAYFGGIQHDVTELVEARAELARRESYMRAILDGLHVAVATADETGALTYLNQEACATLGVLASESVGRSAASVLRLPAEAAQALQEGKPAPERFDYMYHAEGQPPREIGLSMRRGAGPSSGPGWFLVFRDVAQQRNAERVERLAAMSTLAAGFAHEVRNPLASLGMLSEMLIAELGPGDRRLPIVERITRQLNRIERLVRTSLRFARPERPRFGRHWPSVIVGSSLEALAPRLRGTAGEIHVDLEPELPQVSCDDAQICQVIVILVNNALDACGAPEGVTIRAVREREQGGAARVRISVMDRGPGVPEHLRATVFHPFFTTKPSGTGLGLSIAQQIVNENRGRIELGAASPSGAVFSVVLSTEAS